MSGKYGLLRLSCNRMTTEGFYRYDDLIWRGYRAVSAAQGTKLHLKGVARLYTAGDRRIRAVVSRPVSGWIPEIGDCCCRDSLVDRVVPVRNDAILPCCNNNCVSVNFLAVVEMRGERSLLDRPRACPNRTSGRCRPSQHSHARSGEERGLSVNSDSLQLAVM
jgi:hypothetical protein